MGKKKRPTHVGFVSLGCVKNLVDSEKMLGQLAEAGCVICGEDEADVIVVNTCGFLDAARTEADEVIEELVERKDSGDIRRIVVAGCLVQRDKRKILDRFPGVDALVGVHNRDDIVRAVTDLAKGTAEREAKVFLGEYHSYTQTDSARLRITPPHYAYLRISEGCNQKCTFCTIPAIRGPMHCKPPKVILDEARELISDGARELLLIGQDTSSYGLGDDSIDGGLPALLRQLDQLDGLDWLRLMYVYPTAVSDDIIDAVAQCESICKYIDIPLQHINDRILKAMHRRVTRRETEELLVKIRERIPGVTIRTTMITGFPGETEAEFKELLKFVSDFKFDALGVFPYSLEPDTPAGRIKTQVPVDVRQKRAEQLMEAQQEIAFSAANSRVDQTDKVLVDERRHDGIVESRNQGQAPSVDSIVIVEDCEAAPGEIVDVRYTGRDGYDLIAKPA